MQGMSINPASLLAQFSDGYEPGQSHYGWVVWVVCALLVLLLQLILAIWVYKDAGQYGKSRGLWVPICAIPVIGLAAVLIYLMSSTGSSPGIRELQERMV